MYFLLRNKKIIFVAGDKKKESSSIAASIMRQNFSVLLVRGVPGTIDLLKSLTHEIIIIEDDHGVERGKMKDFLHEVGKMVFVITQTKKKSRIRSFLLRSPKEWLIVTDYSIARKLKKRKTRKVMTFGINKKSADLFITDVNQKENETNFKVNYKGSIIPFWIKGKLKNKEIYALLPALCLAKILKLNLAKVSFEMKEKLSSFTN